QPEVESAEIGGGDAARLKIDFPGAELSGLQCEAQSPLALLQGQIGKLAIVNVFEGPIPSYDAPKVVTPRGCAGAEPTIAAVSQTQPALMVERLSAGQRCG